MTTRHLMTILALIGLLFNVLPVQALPIDDLSSATTPAALQAGTYYVDAVNGSNTTGNGSAAAPWKTITYALSQVVTGDTVAIAPGLYDTALGETFPLTLKPDQTLLGSGRDLTILSGMSSNPVVSIGDGSSDFSAATRVSDLTLQNGSDGLSIYSTQGHIAAPTVINVRVRGNALGIAMRTSAVYEYGATVSPLISNTEAIANSQHGIYVASYGYFSAANIAPKIVNCLVANNGSHGINLGASAVGANGTSTNPYIVNTRVQNNGGHGIWSSGSYQGWVNPQIERSWIDSNGGYGFGWAQGINRGNTSAAITNTMITRNQSGGIYLGDIGSYQGGGGALRLVNVTIGENANYGIYWSNANGRVQPDVVNSIIWNTAADDLFATTSTPWSTTEVRYSDIQDGDLIGQQGNLSIDPGFADAAHGDFHLQPTSTVSDSGNNAALLPLTDIDGDARLLGSAVAMGADETQPYQVAISKSEYPTGTVRLNDTVTYTLTLTNSSTASAGGALVTDTLPAETSWNGVLQASVGYATISNGILRWAGTLPAASAQTITYGAIVQSNLPVGTIITNTATIDDRLGGISTTLPVTLTVGPTVLWNTSTQTVDAAYARPGQRITYTVSARNTGNASAYAAIVTDTLDNHVTFAAADASGVWDTDRVVWHGLTVTNGAAITLTVAVTINTPLSDTTPIANQVKVGGDQASFDLPVITTTVYNPPLADFAAVSTLGAVPFNVTFNDHSQHAMNYLWTYGDGATSAVTGTHQHTYSPAGFYTVTLRVSNPVGTDVLTRTNYITAYNAANASFMGSPTTGLAPLTVNFINSSANANQFIWNYGDGVTSTVATTVHSHQYTTAGFYTVTLTAIGPYNRHTYTRTNYIAAYNHPVGSFSATPREGNAPLLVSFSNSSLYATSYYWNFGDGSTSTSPNPQHYYLDGGTYTVTLTASNPAASDTLVRPAYIAVHAPPTAGFTAQPTVGVAPLAVTLINTSQLADTYVWSYGDGITSTIGTPTHTHIYAAAGSFTVTLDADSPYGHNTLVRPSYIQIYSLPVAGFSATPLTGVAPLSVTFSNTSQFAETFWWSFGDGSTSSAVAPTHVYTAGGVYTVSLRAINPGGSTWLTYTSYITVEQPPIPDFQAQPVVGFEQLTVTFTNTSQFAESFAWDYGDNFTSTIAAFTHTHFYAAPGVYTVTLAGTNQYGTRTVIRTNAITVFTEPTPGFTAVPTLGAVPLTVQFHNTSSHAGSFMWSFGDGFTSTAVNPLHIYTTTGQFTVSLTASNPYASATISQPNAITAYYQPTIDFSGTPTIGTAPLAITFTRSSSHATQFWWDYGDGSTNTTPNLTHQHTYTSPGVYTVTVTASNAFTSTTLAQPGYIIVYAPPMPIDYYVDPVQGSNLSGNGTPDRPWRTITYAIMRVVDSNVTIHAAPGVYNTALGESFPLVMKSGVSLMGKEYTSTILSGAASTYVVYFPNTRTFTETTRLSGFKIMNGSEGVHVEGRGDVPASPVIEDNWVTGNYDGLVNQASVWQVVSTVIRHNRIDNNSRFGIYVRGDTGYNYATADAHPTIDSNRIVSNGAEGIYCYAYGFSNFDWGSCSPSISNNIIAANGGSGIRCDAGYAGRCSSPILDNVIAHNGDWGVRNSQGPSEYWTTNYPRLINNLIYDNANGGAIFFISDEPLLLNNTIVGNHAMGVTRVSSSYGYREGWPTIINSIVWGHTDDIGNVPVDRVRHTDTGDSMYWYVNGNLWSNPDFVDPLHENYRVAATSPVIDAGDSSRSELPATDLDGNARIMGTTVDMGAYEAPIGLAGSIGVTPNPVAAGQAVTFNLQITNTGVITLHTIITAVLSPHVTPANPLTWTATITPGSVWSRSITATVAQGYEGPITNTLQVASLEGPSGFFTATAQALIPISGLSVVNSGPTVLGQPTILTATITGGNAVTYTWSLGDMTTDFGAVIAHTYLFTGTYMAIVTATNSVSVMTATTTVLITSIPLTPRAYLPIITRGEP